MGNLPQYVVSGAIAGAIGVSLQVTADEISRLLLPRPREYTEEEWWLSKRLATYGDVKKRRDDSDSISSSTYRLWLLERAKLLQSGVTYGGIHGVLWAWGFWGIRAEMFSLATEVVKYVIHALLLLY